MDKEKLLQQILSSQELPTLPNVAAKLITVTANEDATLDEIGDIISQDIALSTKILKICNSSLYSLPQQVSSVHQAVCILGMNAVRSLVLSFSFLTINSSKKHFDFTQFWLKSLANAVGAQLILENIKNANTDEIFLCGLLQNLGELTLAITSPNLYEKIRAEAEKDDDLVRAEKKILGINHAEIGAAVAENWGFPEVLSLPILHHIDPLSYKGKEQQMKQTIAAVYLSNLLTNILFFPEKPQKYHQTFRNDARKLLGLKPPQIESILTNIHLRYSEAGEYFNIKVENTKSVQEILQEANIRLSLMNLDFDQMNKELVLTKLRLEKMTKELEEKNRILANLANVDGLTGVFNHRYFQNSLEQEVERATRSDSPLALLLLDIDFFKKFNDTYGHQTGDFILVEFSNLLEVNLRKYDILARYGGEEFVVLLPDTALDTGVVVGEKLRAMIENHTFEEQGEKYHVTVSIGVSSALPSQEDDFNKDKLISEADAALYSAKEKGRNQVVPYSSSNNKKKWFSFK